MSRTAILVAAALTLASNSLPAQAHRAHRHPSGAKIIMLGTLVDPLCAFARQLVDSAQAQCSLQHSDQDFHPALLAAHDDLYLLTFDTAASRRTTTTRRLVGKTVKVDGTVFPAGNAYLIVADSIRLATR